MDSRISEYDQKRQQELNRSNLAIFWLGFFGLMGAAMVYLAFNGGM